jgi:hypothetical protein
MSEAERARFEAWAADKPFDLEKDALGYASFTAFFAWKAWQAALQPSVPTPEMLETYVQKRLAGIVADTKNPEKCAAAADDIACILRIEVKRKTLAEVLAYLAEP